jgi:hypothetical protein
MNIDNRRVIVGLVALVALLAVMLGAVGIGGIGYQAGLSQGLAEGARYRSASPADDVPRAAPAPAPQYYGPQPYYGKPWGWGGFNPIGFCLNLLIIGGVIWLISRLFLRRRFGGRGWRGGPGGWHGPWDRGWGDWSRGGPAKPDESRRPKDGEVI